MSTKLTTPVPHSSDVMEMARQVLASQSFSLHMGLEVQSIAPGSVEMRLPVREEFLQHHRVVHGGVTSFLADCTLAYVGSSVLGPNTVTSNFRIDYTKAAQGEYLLARGTVISSGKRQAVCRCEVYAVNDSGEEYLCAAAQGTIVSLG